jgi:hypothetical protein
MSRRYWAGWRLLLAAGCVLLAAMPACAESRPVSPLAGLERKLLGDWIGLGPCDGRLHIKANGTYERRQFGPGGNTCSGAWNLSWDALPPTLTLSCTAADDPAYVGKTLKPKVVQLDEDNLALESPKRTIARFNHDQKQPKQAAGKQAASRETVIGNWESADVTLIGGQNHLELKPDGKFVYENIDVSLGWRTTLAGTWDLTDGRLTLTAQQRRHDGKEVPVGDKKSEKMSVIRRGTAWFLTSPNSPELKKTAKAN